MFRHSALVTYFLVIFATLIPRLLLVGAPPATDEGIYAFNAFMTHAYVSGNSLLPDVGSLSFYSTLLSWVFSFESNPFLSLRLLDAMFAACTGLLLFLLIEQESQDKKFALTLTIIAIITCNDPVFVQYGFKNSIHAALLPLLSAIFIARKEISSSFKWQYVGALTALAVLLREPFIIFAVLGAVIVRLHSGRRAFIAYILGGLIFSSIILSVIFLLRGGYSTLLGSYIELGKMYEAIAYQKQHLVHTSAILFFSNSVVIIFLAFISAITVIITAFRQPKLLRVAVFWGLITMAPLLEPILKNGYPYHFAVSLIGLTGFIACGYRIHKNSLKTCIWIWPFAIAISVFLLVPKFIKLGHIAKQYPPAELLTQKHFSWPDSTIASSNYLLIAEKIKQLSDHGMPTMAISGSMLGLMPLANALPSHYSLSHFSYALLADKHNGGDLRSKIYQCPPEYVVITTSSPFKDSFKLKFLISNIPEYSQVAYLPRSERRHYGTFDGFIYRWQGPLRPCLLKGNHE
ncbi:MAG: hypothetical protein E6Q51_01055 [Methylophilus methylotrophus]|uniref:Glycosyltransferase RgtA/B/C/D-like domain-containing protein n=1 Tax=Methylophilus methylotrophus TaxID=17 RepID=A0A5C7WK59_METME|nr:MAG: hypothetical protein E6Q51_01055 [Methylophilus methylotrophus]